VSTTSTSLYDLKPIVTLDAATRQRLIEDTAEFIPHVMHRESVPGINSALALGDEVIWEAGFGCADLSTHAPMTPRTVLRSGSMGKIYTGTAAMTLVERGLIGLDQPVNEILDFKLVNPLGGRDVTVRDLLTHRAGLTTGGATSLFHTPPSLGEHLRRRFAGEFAEPYDGRTVPLWQSETGTAFNYSNVGMGVLGRVVELGNGEGLSFSEYVTRTLIEPLGMTSTCYEPVQDEAHTPPDIWARASRGYQMYGPLRIPTPSIYFADFTAGGVMTIPTDHIRVPMMFLGGGALGGRRILRSETVREMLTPQFPMPAGAKATMGLQWALWRTGQDDVYIGHGGAHMYGWNNDCRGYPRLGLSIVVACNQWPMLCGELHTAPDLICDFVSSWILNEGTRGVVRLRRSWAWKASYVAALNTAGSLRMLGILDSLTPAIVEPMIAGAALHGPFDGDGGVRLWDPDGFRAGIADAATIPTAVGAFEAFSASDQCQVSVGEQELLQRELGKPR